MPIYSKNNLIPEGFFDAVTIQDFPIRGMEVYLHVKCRRWLNQDKGMVVYRNWELVAKGARIIQNFAYCQSKSVDNQMYS